MMVFDVNDRKEGLTGQKMFFWLHKWKKVLQVSWETRNIRSLFPLKLKDRVEHVSCVVYELETIDPRGILHSKEETENKHSDQSQTFGAAQKWQHVGSERLSHNARKVLAF